MENTALFLYPEAEYIMKKKKKRSKVPHFPGIKGEKQSVGYHCSRRTCIVLHQWKTHKLLLLCTCISPLSPKNPSL